jgi:hypothetical protein
LPSGFGIRAGYERIFGIETTLGGESLDTFAHAFDVALEFAVPVGRFALTPRSGFMVRRYQVDGSHVPDPHYELVTAGLEAAVRYGMFLAALGWDAHVVLDAGSLQSDHWFPHATGFGWQADGRVGVAPTAWFDVYGLVEYEAYAFDLHVDEPASYPSGRASGSYDRYLRFGLGVRFSLPLRPPARERVAE